MAKLTFFPLGYADCCLIVTDYRRLSAFDLAEMHNPTDSAGKRMPLASNTVEDIGGEQASVFPTSTE